MKIVYNFLVESCFFKCSFSFIDILYKEKQVNYVFFHTDVIVTCQSVAFSNV